MLKDKIQHLPCPVCKTPIPFTVEGLLKGERFICPNCGAAISLPTDSRGQVEKAIDGLEKLKANIPE